jgi:hypothetical protein
MITYKTNYHTISANSLEKFNKELKEYVDNGYIPFSGVDTSMCRSEDEESIDMMYTILLSKTTPLPRHYSLTEVKRILHSLNSEEMNELKMREEYGWEKGQAIENHLKRLFEGE